MSEVLTMQMTIATMMFVVRIVSVDAMLPMLRARRTPTETATRFAGAERQ